MLLSNTESNKQSEMPLLLVERLVHGGLALCMLVPMMAIGIMVVVFVYQAFLFFQEVSLWQFIFDTQWTPRFSIPRFGIGVLINGTLMITAIALVVAIPLGTLAAIYLAEYAPLVIRRVAKPVLEALAGVPTIVYGYFALQFVTPHLRHVFPSISGFNALSAGLVTGALIVPIISSISEDAIRDVPKDLREAAYATGFTRFETLRHIIIPSALPGMGASYTLAASRAFGETMIASIAAGQYPNISFNPLDAVASLTAFIVQVSLGDVPNDTLIFSTIFTVGLVLFLITLSLNYVGQAMVRRYTSKISGLFVPIAEASPRELSDQLLSPSVARLAMDGGAMTNGAMPNMAVPRLEGQQIVWSDGAMTSAISVPQPAYRLSRGERASFQPSDFRFNHTRRIWGDRTAILAGLLATSVGFIVFDFLLFGTFQDGLGHLDWAFMTSSPSRTAENAGILPALLGSIWLLILPAFLIIPIGVGAAVYNEEYLPQGRLRRFLDLNIANAAAIPSILYGIIGLAIFVRGLGSITGGRSILSASLVMTIIALPIFIISAKASLRTVPEDLREAAHAVGMTRSQMVWTVVLPEALPGIVTGTLLSLSRIVGETSALLAMGALAFVSYAPALSWDGLQSSFTTIPTQIYFWAIHPKEDFHANAAASVIVLGGLVLGMNVVAVVLKDIYRRRY